MEWTKEALTAGVEKSIEVQGYPRDQVTIVEFEEAMAKLPAVLDAVVRAQGIGQFVESQCDACTVREDARADALEEAAKTAEQCQVKYMNEFNDGCIQAAAAIRNLK